MKTNLRASRRLPALLACTAALLVTSATAQLAGPPGGVPLPAAPIASDRPKAQPPVPTSQGGANFRIRLLDGRSGLPIRDGKVRLWYDERDTPGYLLTTNARGEALMPEPALTPVRILVAPDVDYDCRKLSEREAMPGYNLQETAGTGLLAVNRCGSATGAVPHPGELTLFARPLRWYEQVNRQ